ncbi:ATP-binding protein [Chroococcidiopsis sp. TS-821]|uniref:ATP-binding protein n=1 Tax=Chroococcidiopsis sp. TS-821 TaxID=1378066 RepID=UPI000CEE7F66|nr:ATP-binding protein [Chroococcidiopsis sp. TS-821]PPS42193.1 two-component sensor histidine kinase [Chroococcidiopsis sp. TS-821]
MSKSIVPRRWTLQQQLTILIALFLCLGGAALWLLAELFHSRESAIAARTQGELARANARLMQHFWEDNPSHSPIVVSKKWDDYLWKLSHAALSDFPRVEGGFYIFSENQLLGYAYPTHGGPVPKRDIPQAEKGKILELVTNASRQHLPQEMGLYSRLDIVVLRADPLPLGGAVWTMKRIPRTTDARSQILTTLAIVMVLCVVGWTVYITIQLRSGVLQLQQGIKAIEQGKANMIPPLPAEMGQVGASINIMQQRRQELEQRLRRVDRLASLGQLVAGVAHEVRNPLASMRLNLQYVKRQLHRQEITNLPIPSLLEQVDRLETLVKRLLYFDKTQQEEEFVNVSLEAIAEEAVSLLRPQAEQQDVALTYFLALAPLPEISLQRRGIEQVILNLILNAIQASIPPGEVKVGVKQQDQYLIVWVEDRGVGILPEQQERIFDPFYSTKADGTGLGLAISHEIVTHHGGYIDLQSHPGCTKFSVYLPLDRVAFVTNSQYAKNFNY